MLEPHVRAFDITGRPMRNWVAVEPEGVEDDDQLKEWVERAVKFDDEEVGMKQLLVAYAGLEREWEGA